MNRLAGFWAELWPKGEDKSRLKSGRVTFRFGLRPVLCAATDRPERDARDD
jgi:hypothetical protein